jgi:MFS family permease
VVAIPHQDGGRARGGLGARRGSRSPSPAPFAGILSEEITLGLSSTAVGAIATVYLAGEVVGALLFGRLSDMLGRRKLFLVTLGVFSFGSGLTALTLGSSTGWIVSVRQLPAPIRCAPRSRGQDRLLAASILVP